MHFVDFTHQLKELQEHLKAELAANPFVEISEKSRRRALESGAPAKRSELFTGTGLLGLVVDTQLDGRWLSLVLAPDRVTAESRYGQTVGMAGEECAAAVREMVGLATQCMGELEPVESAPYPRSGRFAVWVRTAEGLLATEADKALVLGRGDSVSLLLGAALDLLRRIVRQAS